jgi:hypothetical protein
MSNEMSGLTDYSLLLDHFFHYIHYLLCIGFAKVIAITAISSAVGLGSKGAGRNI